MLNKNNKKLKQLTEITNTMKSKNGRKLEDITNKTNKIKQNEHIYEDIEHAVVVPDSEIISLHLDVSSDN